MLEHSILPDVFEVVFDSHLQVQADVALGHVVSDNLPLSGVVRLCPFQIVYDLVDAVQSVPEESRKHDLRKSKNAKNEQRLTIINRVKTASMPFVGTISP